MPKARVADINKRCLRHPPKTVGTYAPHAGEWEEPPDSISPFGKSQTPKNRALRQPAVADFAATIKSGQERCKMAWRRINLTAIFSAITAIQAPLTNIAVERPPRLRAASFSATLPSPKIRPRLNTQDPINSSAPSSKHIRNPSFRLFEKMVNAQSTTASKSLNAKSLAHTIGSCSARLDVAQKNAATRTTAAAEIRPAPNQSFSLFAIVLLQTKIGVCASPSIWLGRTVAGWRRHAAVCMSAMDPMAG